MANEQVLLTPGAVGVGIVAFAAGLWLRLPLDPLVELVGISLAGHVTIAWTAIALHARRQEAKWSSKVHDEWLPESEKRLIAAIPRPESMRVSFPPEMVVQIAAAVTDSVESRAVDRTTQIAEEVNSRIRSWLVGEKGNAIKNADRASLPAYLKSMATIDTGNPVIDGLWAVCFNAAGPQIVGGIQRKLRGLAAAHGLYVAVEGEDEAYTTEYRELPSGQFSGI